MRRCRKVEESAADVEEEADVDQSDVADIDAWITLASAYME